MSIGIGDETKKQLLCIKIILDFIAENSEQMSGVKVGYM